MYRYEDLYELVFDNLKRIVFPEEWLALDLEMSKQELFSLMMADRQGELTMSQLSDHMNAPMSTATGIVDRLVKKGYVQRGRSETDRRIVAITLTDKGKAFAENIKTRLSGYLKGAFDALSEEERLCLFRIVGKVAAAFQQIGTDAGSETEERNKVRKIEIE